MKNIIFTVSFLLIVLISKAQQPPAPPTAEERLKHTTDLLQKEVNMTEAQKTSVKNAFKTFITASDKLHKNNPPPPPPPDAKTKEAMDKLVKERDEAVKKVLTADQFAKYKEAVKKLHPPRPGHP